MTENRRNAARDIPGRNPWAIMESTAENERLSLLESAILRVDVGDPEVGYV